MKTRNNASRIQAVLIAFVLTLGVQLASYCKTPEPQKGIQPRVGQPEAKKPEGPGYLGIRYQPTQGGMLIVTVLRDSPAEAAGLRPGDLIVTANGVSLQGVPMSRLRLMVMEMSDGEELRMDVLRESGRRESVSATIRTLSGGSQYRSDF